MKPETKEYNLFIKVNNQYPCVTDYYCLLFTALLALMPAFLRMTWAQCRFQDMLALSDQKTDDGIVINDEDFLQTFGKSLEICY